MWAWERSEHAGGEKRERRRKRRFIGCSSRPKMTSTVDIHWGGSGGRGENLTPQGEGARERVEFAPHNNMEAK
jgi:hypothetical protein